MKRIVFDLDGTLLDSRQRHTTLLGDVCAELEIPITERMLEGYLPSKLTGVNTRRYLTQFCGFSEEESKQCSTLWEERIENWEYLTQDILYPDTIEILSTLKKTDRFELILLTARKNKAMLMRQLDWLGILQIFSDVCCVSPAQAKAGKRNILKKLEHISCMVGDTEVDYSAAIYAGCPFYALARGFRGKNYWNEQGVESHDNLRSLLACLQNVERGR